MNNSWTDKVVTNLRKIGYNKIPTNLPGERIEQLISLGFEKSKISEKNKEIFYRYYKDGKSYIDIAKECNSTNTKIGAGIRVSLRRLAKYMEEECIDKDKVDLKSILIYRHYSAIIYDSRVIQYMTTRRISILTIPTLINILQFYDIELTDIDGVTSDAYDAILNFYGEIPYIDIKNIRSGTTNIGISVPSYDIIISILDDRDYVPDISTLCAVFSCNIYKSLGVYLSCVVSECEVVYSHKIDECENIVEHTSTAYKIECTPNPEYINNFALYRTCVCRLSDHIAESIKNANIYIKEYNANYKCITKETNN